jgi:hypothetical protein
MNAALRATFIGNVRRLAIIPWVLATKAARPN